MEAFDRGSFGVIGTEVHDLSGSPLLERPDPEIGRERLDELGSTGRERCLQLFPRRPVGQADEEGPVPAALIDAGDHILGSGPVTRPPEALERPDAIRDTPSLEREMERVGRRVEAGHARCERGVAGLAVAVDHDEPVRRQVQEANGANGRGELVCPIGRMREGDGRV
jgi:hypothetical protein